MHINFPLQSDKVTTNTNFNDQFILHNILTFVWPIL